MFITVTRSGRQFLIDSGADISVIPPVTGHQAALDLVLTAANGTRIRTYGLKDLRLNIGRVLFRGVLKWLTYLALSLALIF